MSIRRTVALAALALALVVPAGPASATTVTDCSLAIGAVRTDVAVAAFRNERDRTTSDAKLADAQAKLAVGKPADAVVKMTDFRTRIQQLVAGNKLPPADGTLLVAGADGVIACIGAIGS